jgi:hypothetical protein
MRFNLRVAPNDQKIAGFNFAGEAAIDFYR